MNLGGARLITTLQFICWTFRILANAFVIHVIAAHQEAELGPARLAADFDLAWGTLGSLTNPLLHKQ